MKCPADIVTACDKEPECFCGFCFDHCICEFLDDMEYGDLVLQQLKKIRFI